jgi:DNA-directed RNA polymerase subunit beta'
MDQTHSAEYTGGSPIVADIELVTDAVNSEVKRLQLVILESLIIRKDIPADVTQGSTSTKFNVVEGQEILPKAVVAKRKFCAKSRGLCVGSEKVRKRFAAS